MKVFSALVSILIFVVSLSTQMSFNHGYKLSPRIYRGDQADPRRYPHIVSLREVKQLETLKITDYKPFCAGAILNDHWIVSAAHCFKSIERLNTTKVVAVLGAFHFWRDGVIHKINRIIVHNDYNSIFKTNDISLIETASRILFSSKIQPIAISKEWVGAGKKPWFAGWGETERGITPIHLNEVKLLTIDNDACIKSHNASNQIIVHKTTLCTLVGPGTGTCRGDSGGPLELNGKLIGILSWGVPCAVGKPDQFTRIASYTKWVEDNTADNGKFGRAHNVKVY